MPKALFLSPATTESATKASRGAVLIPFPARSKKRLTNGITHVVVSNNNGLATAVSEYPISVGAFLVLYLSLNFPETIFNNDDVASATPSITPMIVVLMPRVPARNNGKARVMISPLISLNKLAIASQIIFG